MNLQSTTIVIFIEFPYIRLGNLKVVEGRK